MTPELAERVVRGLKAADIDFVAYLPESRLIEMLPLLERDEAFTVVCASHEGTAVSIACGAALVGRHPMVYMEASGLFLSLYNVLSVGVRCGLPLLLFVSHTGSPGDQFNSATFAGYGARTVAVLDGIRIPYQVVDVGDGIEERIADVVRAASAAKAPACLLLTGEFTHVAEGQTP
jgi:sulfopyruvate decarboxylase subunit alpha